MFLLCAALAATLLTGCVTVNFGPGIMGGVVGRGNMETHTYAVGEIREIRIESACNIEFYTAPSNTVTLEIQRNLLEYFVVEERNGVLTIRATRTINWHNNLPTLTVSTPALERLVFSGAGSFTAHDPIIADSLNLNMSGAARISARVEVDTLDAWLSGAGDITLRGTANTANLIMSGAGRIEAMSLIARDVTATLSGVGAIQTYATDRLRIHAGGVGSVEHAGAATVDYNGGGVVTVRRVD
jgi:hypothetical protein